MNVNNLSAELRRLYGNRADRAREGGRAESGDAGRSASETSVTPPRGDSVSLSTRGQEIRRAIEYARSAPDIREARVAELRQQIADGTYRVPAESLVDRILGGG